MVGETTEDIIVTWRGGDGAVSGANDVHGQRYGVDGTPIGATFDITSGQTSADTSGTAGLLDGRFVVVHTQQDGSADVDIRARVFDTNNAIDPVIERDAGGPRGAEPGTVFDDIIDGRDREDILHGGLGDDVLIGGVNDDTLFGDSGHDVLIGGTGTDILVGDGAGDRGDDVLMGGYGRDYISGGAGVDTLSYKGEARAVDIDLEAGVVRSDPLHNAVVLPAAGSIAGLAAGAFTDATIEDLIGRISVDPISEVLTFTAEGGSIENAEGSLGNDTIRGTSGRNILTGLAGDDLLDGRGGDDIAVFRGQREQYLISSNGDNSFSVHDTVAGRDGTDTVLGIEHLQFADGSLDIGSFIALNDTLTVPAEQASILNVLANDVGAGLTITSINGTPVEVGGAAVVLASGSLELLSGGLLRFTPNGGFAGPAAFDYTVANADGLLSMAQVTLAVKANVAPTAATVENVASVLESNGNAQVDIKVGDIVIVDDGLGSNTITLSGADAGQFKLVGTELFLTAGIMLNAEAKPSYDVHIAVTDSALAAPAVGTDFGLQIGNINEAPTGIALSATSVGENAIAGSVIGTLSALDPDFGDKAGFELTNTAGGAFALIGNQIVVANPALLDFEAGTTKTISVLATDAGGLQLQKDIGISLTNLTGTSDNVVAGGNANTINGTAGNDFIAGLGGDDTLNGNAGNDILDGGAGKDNMSGGAGDDTYVVDNSGDKVTEPGGQGTDTVLTTLTSYTLASNVENLAFGGSGAFQGRGNEGNNLVIGGSGNDQLQGDKGNDTLLGAAGNDALDGGDGNDVLLAGQGSDSLLGGKGSDRLEAGAGNDVLSGGNDADVFVFRPGFGADVVTDFTAAGTAHDMLELAELQAAHAIAQVGADTVLTLNSDPAHLDQITLRGVAVSALTADHFWFL